MTTVSSRPEGLPGEIVVGAACVGPQAPAGDTGDCAAGSATSDRAAGSDHELNAGRPVVTMPVENLGDRPVQVGSHFHFAEANRALHLDRSAAWGRRLDIPAGTSIRFEPGIEMEVTLVPLAGRRRVPGLRGLAAGPLDCRAGVEQSLEDGR